ncbi:MAG: hypothetical protein JSU75_03665 [Gammaproteobacteria bacterium]|nr:MAG: hypothetical protein JSU75_03665 [Gammaproteobacteria bacterium]
MLRRLVIEIAVLLSLALLGYAAWWLYDLGKRHGVAELESLRNEHARLVDTHEVQARECESLRERVAILDRSSSIDRKAAQDVQDELGVLQDELQSVREEVEFYRGIVSPGDVKPGLHLHRFELVNGPQPGQFHYDLVLTQLKRNDRYVKGVVEWEILGEVDGEQKKLDLAAVTTDHVGKLDFRFRYYQHLTGVIILPEGFQAQQVRLSVKATGKNAQGSVEQVFAWPVFES